MHPFTNDLRAIEENVKRTQLPWTELKKMVDSALDDSFSEHIALLLLTIALLLSLSYIAVKEILARRQQQTHATETTPLNGSYRHGQGQSTDHAHNPRRVRPSHEYIEMFDDMWRLARRESEEAHHNMVEDLWRQYLSQMRSGASHGQAPPPWDNQGEAGPSFPQPPQMRSDEIELVPGLDVPLTVAELQRRDRDARRFAEDLRTRARGIWDDEEVTSFGVPAASAALIAGSSHDHDATVAAISAANATAGPATSTTSAVSVSSQSLEVGTLDELTEVEEDDGESGVSSEENPQVFPNLSEETGSGSDSNALENVMGGSVDGGEDSGVDEMSASPMREEEYHPRPLRRSARYHRLSDAYPRDQ